MDSQKIVLVTGCSYGLGTHIAKAFASDVNTYYKVWATVQSGNQRDRETMEKMAGDLLNDRIHIIELDLTKAESIEKAVASVLEKDGKIDVLVNNAAHSQFGVFEFLDFEKGREVMEVNFFGHAKLMQLVVRGMKKARSGRVINVSSLSTLGGCGFCDFYVASKAALEGLSESLASVMRPFNVWITIVQLSAVRTNNIMDVLVKGNDSKYVERSSEMDDLTAEMFQKQMNMLKDTFNSSFVQEPGEVADKLKEIAEQESPSFRQHTNDIGHYSAARRFHDVSGDNGIMGTMNQLTKKS